MIKITKRWFYRGYLLRIKNRTTYNVYGDCPTDLAKHAAAIWKYI